MASDQPAMPRTFDVAALASEIKAAQDSGRQIAPLTSRFEGFDLDAAYEVAHRVHEARLGEGAVSVGRKIGFTNPDMWALYGVRAPIWAYVCDTTVRDAPGQSATCSLGRHAEPKIEPEIVFGFRAAPRAGSSLDEILASIEWVAHGFEIVQSHFPGWKFQAPDTVADQALHAALLVGERVPIARLGADAVEALSALSVSLHCDGVLRETGRGTNVLGSPLLAISFLLDGLADRPGDMLQAGEIVTTGTITTALPVRPGETWTTTIDGIPLPGLTLHFTA